MGPIIRLQIQKIIEENPDAAQATAKILDFMDREFDVSADDWFENDPDIFVFFDRYCSDADRPAFKDLPLDTEFIYKGERMIKTGETVAKKILKSTESFSEIDFDINSSEHVYEVGLYDPPLLLD